MIELGGNVCIRNGLSLDYTIKETIESLLPVCERVYVADGQSDDGTEEMLREWADREPKISVLQYPWPKPRASIEFWVTWINWNRQRIAEPFQIQLDGDEILHENSYPILEEFKKNTPANKRVSLRCARYNFWRDAKTLIPPGHCLGHRVVRVAPTKVWLPSDGEHVLGQDAIAMAQESDMEIMHYGFLRNREAYFEKSKKLHGYFFDTYDDRLVEAEKKEGNWMAQIENVPWTSQLQGFPGSHPALAVPWLKARNYDV